VPLVLSSETIGETRMASARCAIVTVTAHATASARKFALDEIRPKIDISPSRLMHAPACGRIVLRQLDANSKYFD
jgi:hypothetical protein